MPLRPFPYPFSIGTDICHINRIFTLLCRPQGSNQINQCKLEQFLNKCLTGVEIDLFRKHGPPSHQEWKVASHLAGRWAAKEAIIKASKRRLFMRDIVIYRDDASHQAPVGVILNKQSVGSHEDGNDRPLVSDPGASHAAGSIVGSSIAAGSVSASELPRGLLEMDLDGQIVEVSISHDKEYAVAVAVVPHT